MIYLESTVGRFGEMGFVFRAVMRDGTWTECHAGKYHLYIPNCRALRGKLDLY